MDYLYLYCCILYYKLKKFPRQDLIPNVMSEKQAQMILQSGKAVNFLNVICEKKTPITGARERLHKMKGIYRS